MRASARFGARRCAGRIIGVAAAALLCLPACQGYSSKRLTDFPRARTIAVAPFTNTGYRRDLELRLTQAVVEEVRARSSLALSDPATADLVLRGEMGAVEDVVGLDDARMPIQRRLRGAVRITLTERSTGRVLRDTTLSALEEFRPGVMGESLEGTATDEWARRLAVQVAQLLERPF